MEVLGKNLERPSKRQYLPFQLPIEKRNLIKGTFNVMCIKLSKIKKSLYTIDSTEARHQ